MLKRMRRMISWILGCMLLVVIVPLNVNATESMKQDNSITFLANEIPEQLTDFINFSGIALSENDIASLKQANVVSGNFRSVPESVNVLEITHKSDNIVTKYTISCLAETEDGDLKFVDVPVSSTSRDVVTTEWPKTTFDISKGTLCDSNLNPIPSENSYEYYITNNQNAPIALQTYIGSNPLPTNRSIHFINNPSDSIGMYLMAEVKANGKTATLNINVAPDQ